MASREKRLEKMAANPKADWAIADVQALCEAWGISFRRGGGSHCTVSHSTQPDILTIPANRPIKPVYIRRLVEFVARVSEGARNGD